MDSIIFGQKCIVYDKVNKKILVLERSNYKQHESFGEEGFYDMIGGSVDFGEDSKEAIVREGEEECGIIIRSLKIVDLHSRIEQNGNMFFIFGLYFCDEYEYKKQNIELSHEHKSYKWVNIDEFKELKLRKSTKYVKDIIIDYMKLRVAIEHVKDVVIDYIDNFEKPMIFQEFSKDSL